MPNELEVGFSSVFSEGLSFWPKRLLCISLANVLA